MKAKIFKTNGEQIAVEPSNGEYFTLEEMQGFVGGYIEVAHHDGEVCFICNEEGKLMDLAFNQDATNLWHATAPQRMMDYLVGDVLVCDSSQLR